MRDTTVAIIHALIKRYPQLSVCHSALQKSVDTLLAAFHQNHKLLVCGNGGSAADCEHIVGELMKGFLLERRLDAQKQEQIARMYPENAELFVKSLQKAVPAISLCSQTALMTAFGNDVSSQMIFAQQVLGYGCFGDVLLAISTSGNSASILYAAQIARVQGVKVIGLTGESGGKLRQYCDICIAVPSTSTYKIQELHLPVYHCLCACVENELFGEDL
ncbi:MAG: SIS domain-containing protein [Christensenellales bacterium]